MRRIELLEAVRHSVKVHIWLCRVWLCLSAGRERWPCATYIRHVLDAFSFGKNTQDHEAGAEILHQGIDRASERLELNPLVPRRAFSARGESLPSPTHIGNDSRR